MENRKDRRPLALGASAVPLHRFHPGGKKSLKLLFLLTYYRPHLSGLTIAAATLASGLLARGQRVIVLTSQHESGLARGEVLEGVRIVRVPVGARISKGVWMSGYLREAGKLAAKHDLVVLFLPAGPAECLSGSSPPTLEFH